MKVFYLARTGMGISQLVQRLKAQGIPEEKFSQERCIIDLDLIAVEKGSMAERMINGLITATYPRAPKGWKPQAAQVNVTEAQAEGLVVPNTRTIAV